MITEFLDKQTPQTINAIMWGLATICVILLFITLRMNWKWSQAVKKFRYTAKVGDKVRIGSQYGPTGKIIEMNESAITVIVSLTDKNMVSKEEYIFPIQE